MSLGAIGTVPNNSIIQGAIKLGIVEGVTTSTWNPRSGGTSKSVFKGTQAQITSLAQDAKTYGWEYSIQGGHVWTLEITFPWDIIVDQTEGQSNPLFIWELVNTPFERDIFDLTERKFIGALTIQSKNQIDTKLKTNDQTSPAWAGLDGQNLDNMVDATVAFNLKRSGVRGKQGIVQSLRRTFIVPNDYNLASLVTATNDMKLLTKAQLISFATAGNGGNVLNNIPAVISNAMPASLPLTVYVSPGVYTLNPAVIGWSMDKNGINTFVGYLQYPPEYHMVSNNTVQATQHWVFNKWSAGDWGLYDDTTGNTGQHNPVDSQAVSG